MFKTFLISTFFRVALLRKFRTESVCVCFCAATQERCQQKNQKIRSSQMVLPQQVTQNVCLTKNRAWTIFRSTVKERTNGTTVNGGIGKIRPQRKSTS